MKEGVVCATVSHRREGLFYFFECGLWLPLPRPTSSPDPRPVSRSLAHSLGVASCSFHSPFPSRSSGRASRSCCALPPQALACEECGDALGDDDGVEDAVEGGVEEEEAVLGENERREDPRDAP